MKYQTHIFVKNRKVFFDYEIIETYEAGIVLQGNEVKSIRAGNVQLKDSYARFMNHELWIVNMHISAYRFVSPVELPDPERSRKLLLNKKELKSLNRSTMEKGLSILVLKLFLKKRLIKAALGLCRGKKLHDKRQAIKARDISRDMQQEMKRYRFF